MTEVFHHELTATEPEAVALLFETIGARFSFEPSDTDFAYREQRAGDEDLTVAEVDLAGSYSSWGDTEIFAVLHGHTGRCEWQTRDESGTGVGSPVLFQPRRPTLFVVGALRATNVYLTPHQLQEVADTVYGTEGAPVAFSSSRPVNARLGHYWSSLARLARDTVDSGAFDAPLVRAGLTRHLTVAMLECFPLSGDRETRSLSMAAQIRRYRIAKQFLDDRAAEPVTVEDAARAANTTTTSLDRAFRANHPQGLTPSAYLRRARLAGAHADLLAADPFRGDTVREIAARWGFAHPGHFAAAYRRAYGTPPSRTLQG